MVVVVRRDNISVWDLKSLLKKNGFVRIYHVQRKRLRKQLLKHLMNWDNILLYTTVEHNNKIVGRFNIALHLYNI